MKIENPVLGRPSWVRQKYTDVVIYFKICISKSIMRPLFCCSPFISWLVYCPKFLYAIDRNLKKPWEYTVSIWHGFIEPSCLKRGLYRMGHSSVSCSCSWTKEMTSGLLSNYELKTNKTNKTNKIYYWKLLNRTLPQKLEYATQTKRRRKNY